MRVLMIGVGPKRVGGMWTVADNYLKDKDFFEKTNLKYVATSTNGTIARRVIFMIYGFIKIFIILATQNIDIVHIHMAEKGSVYRKGVAIKMAKKFRCKIVIHMHAGPFMSWYSSQNEKKKDKIREILNMSDIVLVLGDYWKKQMAEIVAAKKIFVLYNGVTVPSENLYNNNTKNIVYMGVLKKEKGIYDLIEAIKLIEHKLPEDINILLCGNDLEGDIESRIRESELQNRILLLGWVNNEQRDNILKEAAINVLPSYYEGLSMTIIEAMSYGVPVLTTDISTMREVLGDEIELIKAGDVDALAKQLFKLLNNKALREKWSSLEYERARNIFSLENNIENTYQVYCDLLK